ncbi:putative GTP-binding protein 6 [Daphnia pulicaria]|uniref:putative GTP-binding protein 6 n=1 Tax=Daphnia pulicaria TaxID=35523 RepID=UPI001EEBBD63|nr:putative GTP-binding protein 6 [Daphnia pulicaria]
MCWRSMSAVIGYRKSAEDDLQLELVSEQDNQDIHDYEELVHKMHLLPDAGHQVAILQPFVKWGPKKNLLTTPDLMLEEAKALVDSLPNWKCVDAIKVPVESLEKKTIFGSGQFESLQKNIVANPNISAVFVSTNVLRGIQRRELMMAFGVPVFDRYSVVLQIFKDRARTREAKLQVAFAEIPYLRSSLVGLQKGTKNNLPVENTSRGSKGGSGESFCDSQLHLLDRREIKIKKELEKLAKKRTLLKCERKKREFPVVAIVGYTNCGKTTLIKSLTGDSKITPRDALFATLDVTVHGMKLPCNLTVLLVDTVGFISNIPVNLIAAFNSTLRDAIDADLLVHLQDISHPDVENQVATVKDTLEQLNIDSTKTVIQVANKIDKMSSELDDYSDLHISAKDGTGLEELVDLIQTKVLEITNRRYLRLMVLSGGTEYSWLHKEATVVKYSTTKDPQYLALDVLVTPSTFGKLRSNFPDIRVLNKQ